MLNNDEVLILEKINKRFSGVHALKNVSVTIRKGDILGVCGENGAGKSTLMKIMSGVYQPDDGEMYYMGQKRRFKTPAESLTAGISIIHQELSYFNDLTVAENIYMNRLPIKKWMINWKQLNKQTEELMQKYGINVSAKAVMSNLPMASKQLVEIIKAMSRNSNIVILDEPTSSLGMDDVGKLMKILRQVVKEGVSFVLISHRLSELTEICNRIIVMRDGENVKEFSKAQFEHSKIVANMIGHDISDQYPKADIPKGDVILDIKNLNSSFLKDVSLQVKAGEIVGLYGMAGSGQDEIMETVFGVKDAWRGTIEVNGVNITPKDPAISIKNGIAYVTADRRQDGLIVEQRVDNNIVLASLKRLIKRVAIDYKMQKNIADRWIDELKIKTPSQAELVGNLSGGNQQKVVLAKWLETEPKVLLLNDPMRGVDIGVKHEIFEILQQLCKRGVAILMISSDMMEMLDITDCIYTIWDGRITKRFERGEATQDKLMLASIDKLEVNTCFIV